MSTHSLQKAGA